MKLQVLLRFKNYNFKEARLKAGFPTQIELSDSTGINKQTIGHYENFRSYPRKKDVIKRLEEALGVPYEILFPEEYKKAIDLKLGKPMQRVFETPLLPAWLERNLLLPDPADEYEKKEFKEILKEEALKYLTEREARVITLRHGLLDGSEHLYSEIGEVMNLTRSRIQQIASKSIEKLFKKSKRLNDAAKHYRKYFEAE